MWDINTSSLLSLLQWCDSNFPTGAFNHSFGLETYLQEGKVTDAASFMEWLTVYVKEQFVYSDGLACRLTHEALDQGQWEEIWKLDRLLTVQNLARETREGARRIGERMIKLGAELYEEPLLRQYRERVQAKSAYGHPAIAFAMISRHLQVDRRTALLTYTYSSISSMVQNGVRAIPLGQTNGQKLLMDLQPLLLQAVDIVEELTADDIGIVSPGLEWSQMKHERLHIRLFMS
ncbi:urease accessory protein UreF [Paenibacillus sp. J2TS4]|uniref:urease accessory protein UreF n=1 Tax=Paenibacillus sp. J2TS4 TaxID=2807194 RepID=UPI001B223113|nr:urease accessory protein UreF [Paenibacillus sp. J2TS4]GIP34860.1 urease accessory protein UreF [Paenibacillus sp. J2TS4]